MKRAAGLIVFYILLAPFEFVPAALIPSGGEMGNFGAIEKSFFLVWLYIPLNLAAISIVLNQVGALTGFWVGAVHAVATYFLPMSVSDRPAEVSFSAGLTATLLALPTFFANLPYVRRLFRGGPISSAIRGMAGTAIGDVEQTRDPLGGLGRMPRFGRRIRRFLRSCSRATSAPDALAPPVRTVPGSLLLSIALRDRCCLVWFGIAVAFLGGWVFGGVGVFDVGPLARNGKQVRGEVVGCPKRRPLKFKHLLVPGSTQSWERYRYVVSGRTYEETEGSSLPCRIGEARVVTYVPQRPEISRSQFYEPPHWFPPAALVLLIALALRLAWAGLVEFVQIARSLRHGRLVFAHPEADGAMLPGVGRRVSLVGFADLPVRDGPRRVAVEIPDPPDRSASRFPLLIEPSGRAMLWSCINPQPLLGADGQILPVSLRPLRWRLLLPASTLAAAILFVSGLA